VDAEGRESEKNTQITKAPNDVLENRLQRFAHHKFFLPVEMRRYQPTLERPVKRKKTASVAWFLAFACGS
jgi:hypothetical protein